MPQRSRPWICRVLVAARADGHAHGMASVCCAAPGILCACNIVGARPPASAHGNPGVQGRLQTLSPAGAGDGRRASGCRPRPRWRCCARTTRRCCAATWSTWCCSAATPTPRCTPSSRSCWSRPRCGSCRRHNPGAPAETPSPSHAHLQGVAVPGREVGSSCAASGSRPGGAS